MLTIDRLHVECRTARDHPSPTDVSSRLRQIVQRRVAGELATRLAATISAADQRVVLIRCLRVRLELDASLDEEVLAQAFAAAIAAGIQASDHDGDVVVSYADDVEQVARLLVDLAADVAWDRWHHRRAFPGLTSLPPTAAIRTVAIDSTQRFLDATARMTMHSLQAVTAALDRGDAERILTSLLGVDPAPVDPRVASVVCELWLDHPAVRANQLLLVLAVHGRVPSLSIGAIPAVARAVHELTVATDAGTGERALPAALEGVDGSLIERVRDELTTVSRRPAAAAPIGDEVTWTTPFGALFLLLPYIVEAGPVTADVGRRRGLALALAGAEAIDDPAVVALLAPDEQHPIDGPVDGPVESVGTATLDWLVRVNAIGPMQPVVRTARVGRRRVTIVVDERTGHWLAVGSGAGTAAAIHRVTDRFGPAEAGPGRRMHLAAELRRLGAFEHAGLDDSMTAANLVRRVANSLPGFATARSAHIWREALDVAAVITVTDQGWHVRVERSPLAELLRICGHGDRTTVVPWLDDLAVRVVIAP